MFFRGTLRRKTSTDSSPSSSDTSSQRSFQLGRGFIEEERRKRTEIEKSRVGLPRRIVKVHRQSGKKARRKMMENPYVFSNELDELSSDDMIIDYSVFSDDSFLLILLLTSKGDVQAYLETSKDTKPRKNVVNIKNACSITVNPITICIGHQASFVVFGLADGNMLVVPIKLLIDVAWGGSNWAVTNVIDLALPTIDPCLAMPTCTKSFFSNFPPRFMAVQANKAGHILLIDLQLRRCVSELRAPQSIHQIDILLDENSIELLVSGFTGAQWTIPIERNGRGFREVLTSCVPADLKVLQPSSMQFFVSENCGVVALDAENSQVEIYPSFNSLSNASKQSWKVPPSTWMVHSTDNSLFAFSDDNQLRSALHFGFLSVRMQYTLVGLGKEWRPLGMVAMPRRHNKLAGIFIVNERGLVRVEQSPQLTLSKIASEFIFRFPPSHLQINSKSLTQLANACGIDSAEFQKSVIPCIIKSRKHRELTKKELVQIFCIAKASNSSMSELVRVFAIESMEEQLLPEVLNTIQSNPTKNDDLMQRVVGMFVKKAVNSQDEMDKVRQYDSECAVFLFRHTNLCDGAMHCARAGMWKSAQILVQRCIHESVYPTITNDFLTYFVRDGVNFWKVANSVDRMQIMSLACNLDWSGLSEQDGSKLCALLSAWQRDITLPSYHQMCLRAAVTYSQKFPRPCQILSLVSSIYILAEKRKHDITRTAPDFQPIAAGHNCAVAIADDERLMMWGNFTNIQQKTVDIARSNGTALPPPKFEQQLPRVLEYPGGRPRAVSCGAEHILVVSSSGMISAWGGNKYGQCGVGHTFQLANLQQLEGEWPSVRQISCGQFHSAFVCDDGSLWTFGWNVWGQLGYGGRTTTNSLHPRKVNGLISKVRQVACGRAHTVILTENGRVLVSGNGSYGQLGVDDDIKKTCSFVPIDIHGLQVSHIATHFYHSICVTEDNRIFEWGRNPQELKMRMFVMKKLRSAQVKNEENGCESPPSPSPNGQTQRVNLKLPAEIPRDDLGLREIKHFLNGPITSISCGLSHSALLTSEESLFTWGKSLDYQLGHGTKAERSEPHQLFEPENVKWNLIALGNNHSLATTTDGRIYGWGRNDFGQCGSPAKKTTVQNEGIKKFYFQAKDGRRFMPSVDESQFHSRPVLVTDIRIRLTSSDCEETVDEDKLVEKLKSSDVTVIQAVSKHLSSMNEPKQNGLTPHTDDEISNGAKKYDGHDGPLCTTSALVHLVAGDVKRAIKMIQYLREDVNTSEKSLLALSSLVWEVIANHEDVQSRQALSDAFRFVPMTDSMKRGKQIAQLWPSVWNDESVQSKLSIDEKIAMLDSFTSSSKPLNCPTISSSSLEVSSRIRVFAQCSHAEPAIVGSPPECSACVDEWAEKVRHTLGASL